VRPVRLLYMVYARVTVRVPVCVRLVSRVGIPTLGAAIQHGTATLLAHHVGNNIHTHPWYHTSECGDVCGPAVCEAVCQCSQMASEVTIWH